MVNSTETFIAIWVNIAQTILKKLKYLCCLSKKRNGLPTCQLNEIGNHNKS